MIDTRDRPKCDGVVVVSALAVVAGAWIALYALTRHVEMRMTTPATMGLGFVAFIGIWLCMMTAMMLPGVVPFASFYTGTFTQRRPARLAAFATGYLVVWAAAGIPAFLLASFADRLVADRGQATVLAAAVFVACGVHQLTPWKDRCLAQCRSPLRFTIEHNSYTGRARDVRAGIHHGAFCLACCWSLMLLLVAFGLMNFAAMVVLTAVVLAEKTWTRGPRFAQACGVAAFVLAVVVVVHPAFASGLHVSSSGAM